MMPTNLAQLKAKWSKDRAFTDAYEALAPEFELARELIRARTKAGLTQVELAARMGTSQAAVARMESGRTLPSTKTLVRYAEATGCRPVIRLVARKEGRNYPTEESVDDVLSRYASPLVRLAEICSRPVEQLAAELGCTRSQALRLQITAAKELAPYLHQKQPVADRAESKGVVHLVIEGGLPGEGAAAGEGAAGGPAVGGPAVGGPAAPGPGKPIWK